jgi:hypothetical protein
MKIERETPTSDNGLPPSAPGRPRRPPIWTYGYVFTPPIARNRIGPIEALLVHGGSRARLDSHIWEGRLVNGVVITHILVVSDSPAQDLEVNELLAAELDRLEAPFVLTASIEMGDPT